MSGRSYKRRIIAGATAGLALAAAALVYAAWTASGTGSGYAKATSAQELTAVDVSAGTTASLYPGADGDVLIEVGNPNPYPVQVTAVTGNGPIVADAGHSTCGSDGAHPSGVTFTDQTGLAIDVAAASSSQTSLAGAAHMSNASDTSCQGATFTIPVSLTGSSNAP